MLSLAIFPLGIDDAVADQRGCDIACASVPWLLSIGFSVIFAALFSKLWRINRVLGAANQFKKVVVTERDVLVPFALLMTFNVILLLSWTLIDPPVFQRVYTDELTSYGQCLAEGTQWVGFICALAVLNFAALVLANVQAFMARSINDELSESKYIGLAMLSMLQIFIVGVPLLWIVKTNPSALFFVWTGIIFIVCTTILGLIFLPKVIKWKMPKQEPSQTQTSSYGRASGSQIIKVEGAISHQSSTATSQVENRETPETENETRKHVSFGDKQSELTHRQMLDDIKNCVLEEHNIDISSIMMALQDDGKVVASNKTKAAGNGSGDGNTGGETFTGVNESEDEHTGQDIQVP